MLQMEQRLVHLTKENRERRDRRQLCWLCQATPVGQKTPTDVTNRYPVILI